MSLPASSAAASRMGAASTELEFHAHGRTLHLAITSARLDLGRGQAGSVLVVEDTTDFLRAQRQLAWKEVAQQVAHEIKNPLTPIASQRRAHRQASRSRPARFTQHYPQVQRGHSRLRRHSAHVGRPVLARWRSSLRRSPAPCDMNQVVEEALALFGGRLEGITVQRNLEPGLPPVLADPEAIRRALANLIDNAAEAMQGSLLRVLGVRTALSEDGTAVEVTVSDTGSRPDRRNSRAAVSALLLHQASRHRPGPLHRRQNRAGAWRLHPRRGQHPQGRALSAAPALDGAGAAQRAVAAARRRATSEGRRFMNHILVVDDEAEIRTSLEEILREEGYGVASAATPPRPWCCCEDAPYDVVLLDIWLPDRDGLDVLGDIHRQARRDAA